ncbi:MAG: bifunctional 3-deoxy-7-phosphoheptulonate synthase/chorismate mutase type II [Bacteroidales bacterium]|nr:bifunctional 3-deoxy-7-phosphoheptulonate synthase/chorismate mutase type II [Bacteroidales bacterium]
MDNTLSLRKFPTIIAGPCSIESPDQLHTIVKELSTDNRIKMIRCGVWKPRTRPGGFEGLGEPALHWIDKEKKENPSLRFCCEVGRPEHVEICLLHNIDAVWLGARTTVNPFLVGEIAEAMKGSGLKVMVKNPITPDVELWIGAIERLIHNNISDIAAVHRGFSTFNNLGYRNNPLWEIPIELKRRIPELPLYCDPSHIAGRRELIAPVSQMALDLNFDGLMIECHPDPDKALTDSQQQITPTELIKTLNLLTIRQRGDDTSGDIQRLRDNLDVIDAEILKLLSQRMMLSQEIGKIKKHHNLTTYQPQRWREVLEKQISEGVKLGLDENFVKELTEKIHAESLRMQE